MSDTSAKPEVCAACGRNLPAHRLLMQSKLTGVYHPVHNDNHCVELFNARNDQNRIVLDTSNSSWGKP